MKNPRGAHPGIFIDNIYPEKQSWDMIVKE
jgi:hypothetical protein